MIHADRSGTDCRETSLLEQSLDVAGVDMAVAMKMRKQATSVAPSEIDRKHTPTTS
jgi:hypothetical protein